MRQIAGGEDGDYFRSGTGGGELGSGRYRALGTRGARSGAAGGRLFNHPDWLEVDRGTLSLHTMARQAEHRTGLSAAENLAILQAVPASLVPDPLC